MYYSLTTIRKLQLGFFHIITLACYIGSIYKLILQLQIEFTFLPFFQCMTNGLLLIVCSWLSIAGTFVYVFSLQKLLISWFHITIFQGFLLLISSIHSYFSDTSFTSFDGNKQIIACSLIAFSSELFVSFMFWICHSQQQPYHMLQNHHNFEDVLVPLELPLEQYDHECSVCLLPIDDAETGCKVIRCQHIFHRECITRWVNNFSRSCPNCRQLL